MEVTTSSEALRQKGRLGRFSDHAGRNASERRAGLETCNAEADPARFRGRLPSAGKRATRAPAGSAGVMAAARMEEGDGGNTGSPVGGARTREEPDRGGRWGLVFPRGHTGVRFARLANRCMSGNGRTRLKRTRKSCAGRRCTGSRCISRPGAPLKTSPVRAR